MPNNQDKIKKIGISKKTALVIIGVVLVATNALTIYLLEKREDSCRESYFINPRISCGGKIIVNKKEYNELSVRLKSFIDDKKAEGKVEEVGIWFRDLDYGPTFGIDDRMDFIPASLLKLPLAIAYLSLAEANSDVLQRTIFYEKPNVEVPEQNFKPTQSIESGRAYTVEELIKYAIVYSDNYSAQLLYDYLKKSFGYSVLSQTYRDLGILEPGNDLDMEAVNTKEYGSIFRQLYNISYLGKDMSEKLLSYMVQSDFRDGLRAGVPEDIPIAHKFGERNLSDNLKQLHDCGIVYYPGNSYELCIMTRGSNFNDLTAIIGEISRQVYEEFDSRRI